MKITPLEIRQKSFEKVLRGYDKDEVTAFLQSMSHEWERLVDENKELKIKLDITEKEMKKLREVESSLFKTLKTAEDTGASLVEQANKAAELHLKESEMNAEAIMGEAKSKAKAIIENAEQQAKELILEMQDAIRDMESSYKSVENHRDNLIDELNNLTSDIMDRIKRTSMSHKKFKLEDHLIKVRELVRESEARISKEQLNLSARKQKNIPSISGADNESRTKLNEFIREKQKPAPKPAAPAPKGKQVPDDTRDISGKGSFFDQI
ncbi:MAG: DivIVA domain-containing protein [Cyclobacteriaceae bacterium]|nr:DivIVA domain-containing protein [Cyclobacteriaceae bacterium]